jgi:GGDEF domain-containing protein
VSVGVARCDNGDGELDDLLHQADEAMYEMKRGR